MNVRVYFYMQSSLCFLQKPLAFALFCVFSHSVFLRIGMHSVRLKVRRTKERRTQAETKWTWVQFHPVLSLGCVTSGKSLKLSGPLLFRLWKGRVVSRVN